MDRFAFIVGVGAAIAFVAPASCTTVASPQNEGFGLPSSGAGSPNSDSGAAGSDASDSASSGANSMASSGASGSGSGSGSAGSGVSNSGGTDASAGATSGTDAGQSTVQGDSGGLVGAGDAGGSCPAPAGITSQQTTALQVLNQTRAAMQSPCDTMVPTLNTSATNHCAYYAANAGNASCISNAHVEVSGCTGFVAANFGNRASMAGYTGQAAFEVMAFNDDPTAALNEWLGSIYHRTPLLDPWTRDFGYGSATGCDTIDLGVGAGSSTSGSIVVSYPYDGQTGVGLSFNGQQESPTPPVPPNGWPSGFPIHVFMQATSITLTTDEFGIDGGAQLGHQVLLPQNSQGYIAHAVVLYGNAPLTSKTTYRVHIAGTRQNQSVFGGSSSSAQFDVSFAFTTQ